MTLRDPRITESEAKAWSSCVTFIVDLFRVGIIEREFFGCDIFDIISDMDSCYSKEEIKSFVFRGKAPNKDDMAWFLADQGQRDDVLFIHSMGDDVFFIDEVVPE